ncbi:MAG: hypothetical protein IT581_08750 [Verrucomicrobiales bacterium]|nr:hypothetical protein [Verrucomicrobiales bacterium]
MNSLVKVTSGLVAAVALFSGVGCSQAYYIIVINGTGKSLGLCLDTGIKELPNLNCFRIEFDERIDAIAFQASGVPRYSYQWKYPSDEFLEKKAGRRGFVVQIMQNLAAYVMSPGSRSPALRPDSQPSGFPLSPVFSVNSENSFDEVGARDFVLGLGQLQETNLGSAYTRLATNPSIGGEIHH